MHTHSAARGPDRPSRSLATRASGIQRRSPVLGAGLAVTLAVISCNLVTGSVGPTLPTSTAAATAVPAGPTSPPQGTLAATTSGPQNGATPTVGAAVANPTATRNASGSAVPVTGHPRLFLQAADLPRLRSWAVDSNPRFVGLSSQAGRAKGDMDAGKVPGQDIGTDKWSEYPAEMYAELFAYMSLISGDQGTRDDYASRARKLLMYVMNLAVQGPADGQPFRDPRFDTADSDRSRWWGEGFALTVDWVYPYLTAADKATILKVFLRWSEDLVKASYQRPLPEGVVNDPALLSDRVEMRWSGNNYYTAHMRNLGLMALALDPADDPGSRLHDYLRNATGAWLYVFDHLSRTDAAGGLPPEGFEYGPQTLAYVAQFLLAVHTAGQDNAATWGPQVVLPNNSFWDDMVTAYFHSLSPATVRNDNFGQVYQPAWYGDGQNYWAPDFIDVFGTLGMYAAAVGDASRLATARWVEVNLAPGGATRLADRVANADTYLSSILYFMLFDPAASAPPDPRPGLPLDDYVPGVGRILARTDWGPAAAWFTYKLGSNNIDHQHADGNMIEFYRAGEWLTQEYTGYDIGTSDYHNTLALENSAPEHNDPSDYRHDIYVRGSQWNYTPAGDGKIVAFSLQTGFDYVTGDATNLYNSTYESSLDIKHASRSVVWLKPDFIVIYDRAESNTAGRFKRFWLNLPAAAKILGSQSIVTTPKGQQLFVTTLLPAGAAVTTEPAEAFEAVGGPAHGEPMKFRLRVEAPGGPASARFLNVLQGADAGKNPTATSLVQSSAGTAYAGAVVDKTALLFAVDLGVDFASTTFSVPTGTRSLVTGLKPGGSYNVTIATSGNTTSGNNSTITLGPGTGYQADSGGVLTIPASS